MKQIRRNAWQTSAKSSKIKLMSALYQALEVLAGDVVSNNIILMITQYVLTLFKDPCVEILDLSGKARANFSARLIKLPVVRGKDAVRILSKETLVQGT